MDKKSRVARKPQRTSTPRMAHKKGPKLMSVSLTDSPISDHHDEHQMDKDSFVRSLQLITSDVSTDEEKRDFSLVSKGGSGGKDNISGESGIAVDNNLAIEQYFWNNPWKNTSVHAHALGDQAELKSPNSKRRIARTANQNNKGSGVSGTVSRGKMFQEPADQMDTLKNKHNAHVMHVPSDLKKMDSNKSCKSNVNAKSDQNLTKKHNELKTKDEKQTPAKNSSRRSQRVRKTPKKYESEDEVRNELTEDSMSDVDVIVISDKDLIQSPDLFNQLDKEKSGSSTPGSDKKRKTLYSFKEKFSDETPDASPKNGNITNNVVKTWEEIGDSLSKIGEQIGIDIPAETKQKKQVNPKKSPKGSVTKKTKTLSKTQDVHDDSVDKCPISSSPKPKVSPISESGSSKTSRSKLLFGKSPTSGQKSKKKRLSEILPIPLRGRAKRKIIDESEKEESENECENESKRKKQELPQREITDKFSLPKSNTEKNIHVNINDRIGQDNENDLSEAESIPVGRRFKRKGQRINSETDTEDNMAVMDVSETLEEENRASEACDGNLNDSVVDNTGSSRTRRSRRGTAGLVDYVQPKKRRSTGGKKTPKKNAGKDKEMGDKDEGNFTCLRCKMNFKSFYYLKHHLMTVHNALWDKDCPEGLTDDRSLATIMKKIKKLQCPKCGKELKFMHYYRKHVQWCGRENEKYYCDLCEKYIMVMWEHEHSLMHMRKDKMEELDKEEDAGQDTTLPVEEERKDGKPGRRSAAKKAVKLLKAINNSEDGVIDLTSDEKDPDAEIGSESSDDDVVFGDFVDEEELEDIKVSHDSKHMYTGGHYANTFYKNLKHDKEMGRYNNVQFPQFCPRVPEWDPLGERDSSDYLPAEKESSEFSILTHVKSDDTGRQKLKRFEAFSSKEFAFLFAGGPVWALAWSPYPQHERDKSQFLAVSCNRDMDSLQQIKEATEGPGLIQIWNIGKLNQSLEKLPTPKLEFCIAHDYGVVKRMIWCPYRSWQSNDHTVEEDKIRQLGLLAIACGDGSIRIFSIPNPEQLPSNNNSCPTVYRPSPEVTLVGHKLRRGLTPCCTSVSWSGKDMNYLLGGYGDGSVRIWDLSTTSTLLRIPTPDQGLLLLPFRSFLPHSKTVTGLNWSPHHAKFFITCSNDRYAKVWSIDNLVMPQFTMKSSALTAAKWPTIVKSVVYSDDDVYVQQKGHIRLQSYGDLTDKNRAINSPLQAVPTGIWDVSVSDWHLMVFCSDFNGDVIGTYYPALFGEKKPHRSKLLLYKVHLKAKIKEPQNSDENAAESSPSKSKAAKNKPDDSDITQTYTDTINKYYLEFVEQPVLDKRIAFDDPLNLCQFPLASVYRVEVNPNLESCMFVASGGQAGIVQIHNVNKYLSFHVARDLRQELRTNL